MSQITHAPLPVGFPAALTVHFRFAETKIFLELNLRSKAVSCPVDTRLDTAIETLLIKAHVNADSAKGQKSVPHPSQLLNFFTRYYGRLCSKSVWS